MSDLGPLGVSPESEKTEPAPGPTPGIEKAPARAWLIWGLAAVMFCYGFFQRVSPSVMIDPLMRDLAVGGALLGNLSALYFYVYAALQVPVGLLHDRWGPRLVLTGGAVLCGAGSLLFSLAEGLTLAYLGRMMIGGGAGVAFIGALALATRWFPPQRFALVSGLTMMAGMIGGIFGQAPLAALVDGFGWRASMLWAGVFGLALAVLLWLIVRDVPTGQAHRPADKSAPSSSFLGGLGRVLRNPANLLLCLVGASMSAPLLAFAGLWGVAWLMQVEGMTRPAAAATCSLLLIGWAIGAPLAGAISDRIGRRLEILIAGAVTALSSLLALIYLPELPAILRDGLFFLAGAALACMIACYAIARDVNEPALAGTAFGVVNSATVAAGAIFQPLVGWLLDLRWDGRLEAGAPVYQAADFRFAFTALILFLVSGLAAALALSASLRRFRQATL